MTTATSVMPDDRVELSGRRYTAAARGGLTDCSLVIATYERPAAITTLLEALVTLDDTPSEVVVVDGSRGRAADEAVAAWLAANTPSFDLAYVRSPAGLTRQRNVGVDASSGALVFFLDDDCIPHSGYFRAIRDVFANDTSGVVGGVAGAIVNNMDGPMAWRWRLRFALGLAQRAEPGSYLACGVSLPITTVSPFVGTRHIGALPGCAMTFRREVLHRHRFSLYFSGYAQGEDLEMSLRVGRDWTLLWCGDAHVTHNHDPQGRPDAAKKGYMEVRNRYFIWKRHARPGAIDRLRFWLDFAYGACVDVLEGAVHPSVSPLRHARGVARGLLSCLREPPRYDEPPARREYMVQFDQAGALDSGAPR